MGRKIETHDKFCPGRDKTLTNMLCFYPYFVPNGTNKQKSKQSLTRPGLFLITNISHYTTSKMLFEKRRVFQAETVRLNGFNLFGKTESNAVILFQTKKTFSLHQNYLG